MPLPRPFNFGKRIDEHAHLLKSSVGNKLVFEKAGMVVDGRRWAEPAGGIPR